MLTPFHIEIREPGGRTLIEIKRGISLLLSNVEVFDGEGNLLGSFRQKLFSIGGKFDVLDDAVAKLVNLPADHCIGPMIAIGKKTKDSWPKPGQLPLSEVKIVDRFPA